jgi:FAD/FMN-containing dehydrogenase
MPFHTTALLGFSTVAKALDAATFLRRSLSSLDACELVLRAGLELVCSVNGLQAPLTASHAAYLLVEAADRTDPTERLADAVGGAAGVADVAVAAEPARRAELWRLREDHTLAINTLGPPHKLDVTLPQRSMAEFIDRVPRVVEAMDPATRTWLFGHVGDGNIHVNVTGLLPDDDRVDDVVFRLVAEYGGSISAEHGIGTAKKQWLSLSRTPAELAMFRELKRALDPSRILNPNVLFSANGA